MKVNWMPWRIHLHPHHPRPQREPSRKRSRRTWPRQMKNFRRCWERKSSCYRLSCSASSKFIPDHLQHPSLLNGGFVFLVFYSHSFGLLCVVCGYKEVLCFYFYPLWSFLLSVKVPYSAGITIFLGFFLLL